MSQAALLASVSRSEELISSGAEWWNFPRGLFHYKSKSIAYVPKRVQKHLIVGSGHVSGCIDTAE